MVSLEQTPAVAALPGSPESPQGAGTGSRRGHGGVPGAGDDHAQISVATSEHLAGIGARTNGHSTGESGEAGSDDTDGSYHRRYRRYDARYRRHKQAKRRQTASLRVEAAIFTEATTVEAPAVARVKGDVINSAVFPDGTGTFANRRGRSNTPARTPDNTARITRTDSGMYIVQPPVTTAPPHEPLAVQGVSPGA